MTVLGVIPARGGSKGIARKNLVPIAGRPLIAHSIAAGLAASTLQHVWVSTDDDEIAAVARTYGAQVPFMRPADLAGDHAPMLGVMLHALDFACHQGMAVEAIVLLQPTSPLRTARHIDEAVGLFRAGGASSVVSVTDVPHQFSPVSVLTIEDGLLRPYLKGTPLITRRQDKPVVYARNGPAVLVCAAKTLRSGELYGECCRPYVMSHRDSADIDGPDDLELVEWLMEHAHRGSGR